STRRAKGDARTPRSSEARGDEFAGGSPEHVWSFQPPRDSGAPETATRRLRGSRRIDEAAGGSASCSRRSSRADAWSTPHVSVRLSASGRHPRPRCELAAKEWFRERLQRDFP